MERATAKTVSCALRALSNKHSDLAAYGVMENGETWRWLDTEELIGGPELFPPGDEQRFSQVFLWTSRSKALSADGSAGAIAVLTPAGYQSLSQDGEIENLTQRGEWDMKEVAGRTGKKLAAAGQEGLKLSGAKQAGRQIVKTIRKRVGKAYPKFFSTTYGRKAEPMLLAGLVHLAVEMYGDRIPQAENLQRNCERIVTAEMEAVGDELLQLITPMLSELASSVPQLAGSLASEEEK